MPEGEYTIDEALEQQTPKKVQEELDSLRTTIQRLRDERHYVAPIRTKSNTFRFAAISDLHTGSLYERFDALREFYKILQNEGIKDVLIGGDILDGHGIYKGQEFELYAHGARRQLDALEDKFPKVPGIRHRFITGNHDYSFDKLVDMGIGESIAARMGWDFLGQDGGRVTFKTPSRNYSVGLIHPGGGTNPIGLSYKPQRIVDALSGGTKPDMLFIAHYHKGIWLPMYRNVSTFLAGCFQTQTPHMARKPTPAHVGGWIIEVILGDRKGLSARVKAEFISFFEPEEMVNG